MSHPDSSHDKENEYPSDDYKPVAKKEYRVAHPTGLAKKMRSAAENMGKPKHTALSHKIEELRERKGEHPMAKLKRLTGYKK